MTAPGDVQANERSSFLHPKVLVFVADGYVVPWDKVAYCERRQEPNGVRIHMLTYGFIDVAVDFDELMQQVVDMVSAT